MTVYQDGIYSCPVESPFEPTKLIETKSSYKLGKILRANQKKSQLVYNFMDETIKVIQINPDGRSGIELDVLILEDGYISDFFTLGDDKIICVTSKGFLAVYQYELSNEKMNQKSLFVKKLELNKEVEEQPLTLCKIGETGGFVLHTFFKQGGQRYAYALKLFYLDLENEIFVNKSEILVNKKKFNIGPREEFLIHFEAIGCKILGSNKKAILMCVSGQFVSTVVFCYLDLKKWEIYEYIEERKNFEEISFVKKIELVGESFLCSDNNGNLLEVGF